MITCEGLYKSILGIFGKHSKVQEFFVSIVEPISSRCNFILAPFTRDLFDDIDRPTRRVMQTQKNT